MPAWLFGGTRQRTKRLEKSASEGDTRIDDNSGGSPLTIEIGAEFPIGIKNWNKIVIRRVFPGLRGRNRAVLPRFPPGLDV